MSMQKNDKNVILSHDKALHKNIPQNVFVVIMILRGDQVLNAFSCLNFVE
jgi:hypothetical protein